MDNADLKAIEKEIAEKKQMQVVEKSNPPALAETGLDGAVFDTKQKIVGRAKELVNDRKLIKKHSESLAEVADKALEVETETQRLKVEELDADNKVTRQEIRNRLIVLKAEAKRLKAEQKQLNADQKADHKARKKAAKWELYKGKLQKMKYDYVPNPFILAMLLFFDGIVGFFNGLGAVSTAIVKAVKWVLLIGAVIVVLLVIPATRDWLLELLQFK